MPNRNKSSEPIKYLIERTRGADFVIEIPANWKLTFASVNPNSQGGMRGDGHCIRVYEGEKLRAVYCDCKGFRDMTIPLIRKVEVQTGNSSWVQDSEGNMSDSRTVKNETVLLEQEF